MADAPNPRSGGTPKTRAARVLALRVHLRDFLSRNTVHTGALVGTCLLLAAPSLLLDVVGVALALGSLLVIVWLRRGDFIKPTRGSLLGYFVSIRAILFIAVGAGYLLRRPDQGGWVWTAVAVGALVTLSEPMIKVLLGTTKQIVLNLPGVPPQPTPPFRPGLLVTMSVVEIVVGGVLAAVGAPGWLFLVLVLLMIPMSALTTFYAVRANILSAQAEGQITTALKALKPEFAVYYAARTGTQYQLGMWLPYLERLNRPFIVITRQPETVPAIQELTSAPILVPKIDNVSPSLDGMVVPSLKAAFYVQGSPANQTFQRYRRLTHVWLNHGDSDKQANFHPRHASFDKLFVSGQQAVERYARHGINVAPDRFVLVGRPQIETIQSRDGSYPPETPRTVLYAPTWKGGRPSTNYSSLPLGADIIGAVLERGARVIFRPHPVSYGDAQDAALISRIHQLLEIDRRATGRAHVWGPQAETVWDLPSCFNESDAVITDVSSIASDYLASGKPFAMVAITASGPAFAKEFPMAKVAYVIEKDLSTLPAVLDHLLGDDTLEQARLSYRTFCLGTQIGPNAAEPFLQAAAAIVAGRAVAGRAG